MVLDESFGSFRVVTLVPEGGGEGNVNCGDGDEDAVAAELSCCWCCWAVSVPFSS